MWLLNWFEEFLHWLTWVLKGSSYMYINNTHNFVWTASSEFGTYRLCEQRRFRRACASAQSRQNLRCSLIQAVSQEEPSDRKPDPWPLWMAGHAQLKFVMTECSKTQIRLTRPVYMFLASRKIVATLFSVNSAFTLFDVILLQYKIIKVLRT